jgi:hypothetical protein
MPIDRVDHTTFCASGSEKDERGYLRRCGFEESVRGGATMPLPSGAGRGLSWISSSVFRQGEAEGEDELARVSLSTAWKLAAETFHTPPMSTACPDPRT